MAWEIEELIKKYQDMDLLDIYPSLNSEVKQLDRIFFNPGKYKQISTTYSFKKYREHAIDLLFFLNTGIIPATIGLDGLKQFLPIIKNLVKKGQLKEEVLNLFE